MLGEHERELDAARRGRAHHPDAISAVLYEGRALAALGDLTALRRCVEEACALPPDPFEEPGAALLELARELRAHGHPTEAAALAERARAWYADNARDGRHGLQAALALYEQGRWADACRVVRELATDAADDVDVIGLSGAAAARMGDEGAAREAVRRLRARSGRFHFGAQFVWIGRVLAVLGDADDAITALHGGFARGFRHGIWLHVDRDLALLASHPAFRELSRPKG